MKTWIKPQDNYLDITTHDNVTISFSESRSILKQIGIPGKILPTPGHSDDSVSLLLDDGAVFTGDLTHPAFIGLEDAATVSASWQLLRDHGAHRVYPGTVRPGRWQPTPFTEGRHKVYNTSSCSPHPIQTSIKF